MTAELIEVEYEDELTDQELLDELPNPSEDEGYLAATDKLAELVAELEDTTSKIEKARTSLSKIAVEDSESADKAAKLDRKIETLNAKSERLKEAVEFQREQVRNEFKRAQRDCQAEIKEAWEDYYVPEIVELVDRLAEIRDIYKQLKNRHGSVLNPMFPPPLHGAIGKNNLWTKKRKAAWMKDR